MSKLLKNIIFSIIGLAAFIYHGNDVSAQPANDNCSGATMLTVNNGCSNGTTQNATVEGGEDLECNGTATQTVWYSFVATATAMDVIIIGSTNPKCYPGSAVWDTTASGCPASGVALSCEDIAGGPLSQGHNLTGLTIGNAYFIQLVYNGGGPCNDYGEFCVGVFDNNVSEDACANAIGIADGTAYTVSNVGSTPDGDLCSGSTENNVWFSWTVPIDWVVGDTAFVHLFGQTCDNTAGMQLSVFKAASCVAIPNPAGAGDCIFFANTQSDADIYFSWVPTAIGDVYYFDIDGFGGTVCLFTFMVSPFKCLTLTAFSTTGASCGGSDGTASASASNSTAPYTYSWSSGGSGTTETGLTAGTYVVTITDADDCQIIDSVVVAGPMDASFTYSGDSCSGTGSITFANAGSASGGDTTFAWVFPSGTPATSTAENPSVTWASTGTYSIRKIATDGTCSDTVYKSVTIVDCSCNLAVGAGNDFATCDTLVGVATFSGSYSGETLSSCNPATNVFNASDAGVHAFCCGTLYDPNGTSNYTTDAFTGTTIGDGTSGYIKICFSSIELNPSKCAGNYDEIWVISGGTLYAYYNEKVGAWTTGNGGTESGGCVTVANNSGYAVVRFYKWCSGSSYAGWVSTWTTVDGSGVDQCGGTATVAWTPTTYLSDPTSLTPTFSPPDVSNATTYQYVLTVTDDLCTRRDTVDVTVSNCCRLSVNAGTDSTFNICSQANMVLQGSYTGEDVLCGDDTLLAEDFSACSGSAPTGWTTNILTGTCDWTFDNTFFYSTYTINSTCGAMFEDYDVCAASTGINKVELLTPAYDISCYTAADITFDYRLLAGSSMGSNYGMFTFDVWDGAAWTTILTSPDGGQSTTTETFDVTTYINSAFQFKITWDDEGIQTWGGGIDNVYLTGTPSSGTPGITWSGDSTNLLSSTTIAGPTFTPAEAGNYFFTMTVIDSCTNESANVLITANATANTTNWNGSVSTDWFVDANWSNCTPVQTTVAIIANTAVRHCDIIFANGGVAEALTVIIEGTWDLTLASGSSDILDIYADFTNNGTFDGGTGTVRFEGTGYQEIGGSSVTNFYNLTVNNTSTNQYVTLTKDNNTVDGVLTLTEGQLALNGNTLIITNGAASAITRSSAEIRSEGEGSYLKWNTSDLSSYVFPFGYNGEYIPFTFDKSTNTGSDVITISTWHTGASNNNWASGTTCDADTGLEYFVDRWWTVTPVPAQTADLTFGFTSAELTTITDPSLSNAVTFHWSGSEPWDEIPATVSGNTVTSTWSSYSGGGGGGKAGPLPIKLLNFIAVYNQMKGVVDLTWTTASETNNAFFTVEKSYDAVDFVKFFSLPGAGNSNKKLHYKGIDPYPYCGLFYYRLKQTDYDGKFEYSKIVAINILEKLRFSVRPNPANEYLEIVFGDISNKAILVMAPEYGAELTIYDARGQSVFSNKLDGTYDKFRIDISQLENGVYLVNLKSNGEYYTVKFVKE